MFSVDDQRATRYFDHMMVDPYLADGKRYAAIPLAPRPRQTGHGPRDNLRTTYGEGIELWRWFRVGLLCCALIPSITGPTDDLEAKIKLEAVAKPKSCSAIALEQMLSSRTLPTWRWL
ncbi:hypothetical protein EDC04DRAFT_2599546 [Pisolithus marmoratus]|nr:hypothetical protein EDC04DRAFT_2599546 [Pisolithus marmoratus]